jgi:hypothetical protein
VKVAGAFAGPLHALSLASAAPAHARFLSASLGLEAVQRARLEALLARHANTQAGRSLGLDHIDSWERFARKVPLSTYEDWEPWILEQQKGLGSNALCPAHDSVRRFEPTSGSTGQRKWIPYTKNLLEEFDAAASAWLVDLAREDPRIYWGRHYWALSWIPTELRGSLSSSDDLELLSPGKRWFLGAAMAVPSWVARLPTSEDSLLATCVHLGAASDLSLVSVWSPTFWLGILEVLSRERLVVARVLETGRWPVGFPSSARAPKSLHAARLLASWDGALDPQFFAALWPRLRLLSVWTSAHAGLWTGRLQQLFPGVRIQGKGLWATEGVVTIPFRGHHVLAATSHFLEFRCLESGRVVPSWGLREGQTVEPVMTTGGGMVRYVLADKLRVEGFWRQLPRLRFLGRRNGIDLVGEKIDADAATNVLSELSTELKARCLSLLARTHPGERSRYVILAEGQATEQASIARACEEKLRAYHHYTLARELGQLDAAAAWVSPDAQSIYERLFSNGSLGGQRKIEPLREWRADGGPRP